MIRLTQSLSGWPLLALARELDYLLEEIATHESYMPPIADYEAACESIYRELRSRRPIATDRDGAAIDQLLANQTRRAFIILQS